MKKRHIGLLLIISLCANNILAGGEEASILARAEAIQAAEAAAREARQAEEAERLTRLQHIGTTGQPSKGLGLKFHYQASPQPPVIVQELPEPTTRARAGAVTQRPAPEPIQNAPAAQARATTGGAAQPSPIPGPTPEPVQNAPAGTGATTVKPVLQTLLQGESAQHQNEFTTQTAIPIPAPAPEQFTKMSQAEKNAHQQNMSNLTTANVEGSRILSNIRPLTTKTNLTPNEYKTLATKIGELKVHTSTLKANRTAIANRLASFPAARPQHEPTTGYARHWNGPRPVNH